MTHDPTIVEYSGGPPPPRLRDAWDEVTVHILIGTPDDHHDSDFRRWILLSGADPDWAFERLLSHLKSVCFQSES